MPTYPAVSEPKRAPDAPLLRQRARRLALLILLAPLPTRSQSPLPAPPPASPAQTEPDNAASDPAEEDPPKATLTVQGLGWIDNLTLKNLLRQTRPTRKRPVSYDPRFVEDGAFLLLNHVRRLGYLQPTLTVHATTLEGQSWSHSWTESESPPIPDSTPLQSVRFVVHPGIRYFYDDLQINGLPAEEIENARAFFIRTDGLLQTRSLRRFSRGEWQDALENLRTTLRNQGHDRATVTVESLDFDHQTGAVRARIRVDKGPLYRMRRVLIRIRDSQEGPVLEEDSRPQDRPLSRSSREDLEQLLLREAYEQGYPDARVTLAEGSIIARPEGDMRVDLLADVIRGPRIRLNAVRFESPVTLRNQPALLRQTRLSGPWIDRLAADEARARLARRGSFKSVRLRYDAVPDQPDARDVVYQLEPGNRLTADLLAGYRSYDLLYGGFDVTRRDLFGLGHVADLRAVQSFRSTEGSLTYSIPDAFGEEVTIYALTEFLSREEVSFQRQEFRSGAGVRKAFGGSGTQVGLRYSYELLRAEDAPLDPNLASPELGDNPTVGAVILDAALDRRDSALNPRSGYRVDVFLETALPEFGGDARYLRPEISASTYLGFRGGRFLNLGIQYSLVVDPSGEDRIPFNKRLFPGGEDSVRGYQRGEAGPLNKQGQVVGAESALVWMLEFEQLITASWSIVTFVDGVAETPSIEDFPWTDVLWSVGAGLRWNSFIGPVRLEYGYNLTRRDGDPQGTLHFSVGVPF